MLRLLSTTRTIPRILTLCLLMAASTAYSLVAAPLSVQKLEPPNWWVGMKWNRVQLMVYGENLNQISAQFDSPLLRVSAVHTLANPSYAFLDIVIPDSLPPGDYRLVIRGGTNSVEIDFPILKRNSDPRRHAGFNPKDVIYLITPDRFANGDQANDRLEDHFNEFDPSIPEKRHGGDLQGIIDHLDYLQDLGITALWLNPVLENNDSLSYHGYKTTNYYRIDPRLGTNEDYRRLVEAAHQRGLKIIFDHVNNHIGINHPWVKNLPTGDWLNGSLEDHLSKKHYKFSVFDPHAEEKTQELLTTFWFTDRMPDLNQRDPWLATYLIQNTLWWIEFSGMDGIREDTYPYVEQGFLSNWAKAVLEEYPSFNIVGEIWAESSALIASFQKCTLFPRDFETNLPAVMDFPLMQAYRDFIQGEGSLRDIYRVFAQDFVYTDLDNVLTFLGNHDTPRPVYLAQRKPERVRLCQALLMTTRGIPQILYGEEIEMQGGARHVELRADFPGGFPGDKHNAFTPQGRSRKENEAFDYLRQLLHLRKQHPALTEGRLVQLVPKDELYQYFKVHEQETIWVIANGNEVGLEIDTSEITHWFRDVSKLEDLLSGEMIQWESARELQIGPMDVKILRLVKTLD